MKGRRDVASMILSWFVVPESAKQALLGRDVSGLSLLLAVGREALGAMRRSLFSRPFLSALAVIGGYVAVAVAGSLPAFVWWIGYKLHGSAGASPIFPSEVVALSWQLLISPFLAGVLVGAISPRRELAVCIALLVVLAAVTLGVRLAAGNHSLGYSLAALVVIPARYSAVLIGAILVRSSRMKRLQASSRCQYCGD